MAGRLLTEAEVLLWQTAMQSPAANQQPRESRCLASCPERTTARLPAVDHGRIDLHGMTVEQAFVAVRDALEHAHGRRTLVFITGLSGVIRREFPVWLDRNPLVRRVEPLDGGGAFKVHLNRSKPSSRR